MAPEQKRTRAPGAGRKALPEGERRDGTTWVRHNGDELALIEEGAALMGKNVSTYLRLAGIEVANMLKAANAAAKKGGK